jgi:transcriptional regulator with XRE-family HTH domain
MSNDTYERVVPKEVALKDAIRAFRRCEGWTRKKLGRRSGISEHNIRLFETGRKPATLHELERMAVAMGFGVDIFAGVGKGTNDAGRP